jgi:predicted aldo/keto reductase-like oxidoreductase
MRLPTLDPDPAHIDQELATRLLHQAIDAGVNYLDTAWPYHNGESEPFVGRALRGGWRDRVQLATKHPVWKVEAEPDWERYLDEQLRKLDTSRIDFYLLHALNSERWQTVLKLGGLAAMERARADGRIRHLGFSFHGSFDAFKTIVDGYDWEFCQIQLNFVDVGYQAGLGGLHYAATRKIGVVVMEPLRGGALAAAPESIQEIWRRSGRSWSPAEWSLRWLWNLPEVVTVLSGMKAERELHENLAVADAARAGELGPSELGLVEQVRRLYEAKTRVPCTTCGYCQPCPAEVSIPETLSLYNAAVMFETPKTSAQIYRRLYQSDGAGADQCTECGECEPKCSQGIAIIDKLKEAHDFLMRH